MHVRGRGHHDWLMRHLPDRKDRAEDEDEINRVFKYAALFFFGTNEQRVGRLEAFGGESFVFHMFDLVDDEPLLQSPCHLAQMSFK